MVFDPGQKAQHLLALAVDSDSEEARNAAKMACRLIHEHKLLNAPSIESHVQSRVLDLSRSGVLKRSTDQSNWSIPSGAASLSEAAEDTVSAFMDFLHEEEKFDSYPRMTTIQLTEKALAEGAIKPIEADIYQRYLLKYLRLKVESGHLISRRRWGFSLFDG